MSEPSAVRRGAPPGAPSPGASAAAAPGTAAYASFALLLAALVGGACAQALLRGSPPQAFGYALAAAALLLAAGAGRAAPFAASRSVSPSATAAADDAQAFQPARAVAAAASLGAALALQIAGRAPGLALACWAASVALWNVAFPGSTRDRWPRRDLAVLAALYFVALAARAWDLGGTPAGLYGDEGVFGMRARALLAGDPLDPFGEGLPGIPALWTWLQAGFMAVFGEDVGGLRAASAAVHAAASPLLYALLRRDLGAAAAAGGAIVLAFSPWNLHFGRMALSEGWMVPCTIGAFGAVLAGLRSGRAAAWVRAGTWVALCFYAGNKAVLLPPALLAGGAGAWLALRREAPEPPRRLPWRGALLAVATALFVFAPQLLHVLEGGWRSLLVAHPQRWLAAPAGGAGWGAHVALLVRALLDHPDTSVFTGWPGMRVVGAGEATLFVAGLGVALARPARPLNALLLGWLAGGLGSLLVDRRPVQIHHLVILCAVPAAFGALALGALRSALARAGERAALGRAAALAAAAAVALQGAHAYFAVGARSWSYAEVAALGRAMHELAPTHHLALVTPRMSWDINSTLLFLAPGVRAQDKLVALDPARRWLEPPGRDVAFLVHGRSARELAALRRRYPDAPVEERRGPPSRLRLAVVRVPAAALERERSFDPAE
ncbi:MAG TPA: glycosyltransferase family 39 protein [Myxococcota bacterium]|nr:glycosyltransferase family 39 protein [Myxococcota bacterium]